jgi:hypothetical protein
VQNESPGQSLFVGIYTAGEIDEVKRGLGVVKDLAANAQSLLPRIIELRAESKTLTQIGRELGLTRQAVRRALAGRTSISLDETQPRD